ncbi:MAG: hypothetical protein LIP77_10490 [Planctomycetes bacterium]|nr:hypothetical protein [Planctomycetota bacterium]
MILTLPARKDPWRHLVGWLAAWCLTITVGAGAFCCRAADAPLLPGLVVRFGSIDAIDAEDGILAAFIRSVRNDGIFIPPMRTFVGPEIRNPTFFGLAQDAWIECALLFPTLPGAMDHVWVFPVDNRGEYLSQLANQGLTEYEGMDSVTVLREVDSDGYARVWYLEWLPGNLAVFGANREAVASARAVYAAQGAAQGLLAGTGGRFLEPDVTIRLLPFRLATWRTAPNRYWWRDTVTRLARDLVAYWRPGSARVRLIETLAEEFAAWPRSLRNLELALWFESEGIEWRLDAEGGFFPPPASGLEVMRRLPPETVLAYATPLTATTLAGIGGMAGEILVAAAGGARLLLGALERPAALQGILARLMDMVTSVSAASYVFSQLGWDVRILADAVAGSASVEILPLGDASAEAFYDAVIVARRRDNWLALVVGPGRSATEDRRDLMEYRAGIAEQALAPDQDGSPGVREAFTRMGPQGASFMGLLQPVRCIQLVMLEAADWRPRSPDQHEPLATQLAREMLEYPAAGTWTAVGEGASGTWRCNGGVTWFSLSRLSAALGITESIAME